MVPRGLSFLRELCRSANRPVNLSNKTSYKVHKLQWMLSSWISANRHFTQAPSSSSTIFALSSGHGRCGVAVIRLSGPLCREAVKKLCFTKTMPKPRFAALKRFYDPVNREIIDRGLLLWFPGPQSFTGEDCAEFHVHGGPAVVTAMLDALGSLPGLRPAEPGDFTRRAFLGGKMNLTEVEGLGDLIHSETSAQRRQAVRQMEGDLGNMYAEWRRKILKCLADVEAFIDFSEDENIEEDTLERATKTIEKVCSELQNHLSDNRRGERLRDGVHVAIIGEPNVGKSSLLNALCQRPAAIVSPIAGTTRDVVETAINLAGYPVLLSDTAGLRETSDVVEKEGVDRALDRASKADLKILVLDVPTFLHAKPTDLSWSQLLYSHMQSLGLHQTRGGQCLSSSHAASTDSSSISQQPLHASTSTSISASMAMNREFCATDPGHSVMADKECKSASTAIQTHYTETTFQLQAYNRTKEHKTCFAVSHKDSTTVLPEDVIVALNKSDLVSSESLQQLPTKGVLGVDVCSLSCVTEGGLDSFIALLADRVKQMCGDPLADSPSITQSRHRAHLSQCLAHLHVYLQQVQRGQDADTVLAAQALRRAMRELGRITGAVNVEDVLDVIFKDFCIGK